MSPIQIFICEESAQWRQYLQSIFKGCDGYLIAGVCANGEDAVYQTLSLVPHVVIMGVGLSCTMSVEATRQIKEVLPDTQVIMYASSDDEEALFASLRAGASGYLLKKNPEQQLVQAVDEVMQDEPSFSPGILGKVVNYFHKHPSNVSPPLCEREMGILKLLVEGLPIKAIASEVHLSEDGVKKNLKNIYHKLHVSCGKEAVAKAVRERIV